MHHLHHSRCGCRFFPARSDGIGSGIQFRGPLVQLRQGQIAFVQQGPLGYPQPSFKIARPQVAGRLHAFLSGPRPAARPGREHHGSPEPAVSRTYGLPIPRGRAPGPLPGVWPQSHAYPHIVYAVHLSNTPIQHAPSPAPGHDTFLKSERPSNVWGCRLAA